MVSKFCKVNPIPYCSTLMTNTNSTCATCLNGYRLDRDSNNAKKTPNVCVAIAAATNCAKWDETNNVCSQCNTGFILYSSPNPNPTWYQCVAAWGYTYQNCDIKNDATSGHIFTGAADTTA
jgi:hypothetical protein